MELEGVQTVYHKVVSDNGGISSEIDQNPPSETLKKKTLQAEETDKDPIFVRKFRSLIARYGRSINIAFKVCLLVGYCVYFAFAVRHSEQTHWTEDSWRLVGVTCLLALIVTHNLLVKTSAYTSVKKTLKKGIKDVTSGRSGRVIRLFFYVAMTGFMVVYVIVYVALRRPQNLQSLVGLFGFPLLLFLYSNNKRKINWHTVFWGMSIQFIMALIILKTAWGADIIRWIADRFMEFVDIGTAGSTFLFGPSYKDHNFVFGTMIQIIVVLVGISMLTYLGVIESIVNTVGKILAFFLHTTAPEGINTIGNTFLHVPESAMFVQAYLPEMTPSQLFVTYAGGLATVSGVALIIFISFGIEAAPLVAASAMSAPAALAASKLVFPSHDGEVVPNEAEDFEGQNMKPLIRKAKSLMDSIVLGIQQSISVIVQAVAFLGTFVMILEFLNRTFTWFGDRVGIEDLTLELMLSYVFYPVSYMLGAPAKDCLIIGDVLGIRTVAFAVVAFPKFAPIVQNGRVFREYTAESVNNTWTSSGRDIFLENRNVTLIGGVIEERSEIIATYALCGSASIALIGFILGTFSVVIPNRMDEISKHLPRAFIAGTVASYLTACFAGLMYEET